MTSNPMDKGRKEVTDYIDIRYQIDCNRISMVIKNLQDLLEKYGDVEIDVSSEDDYGASHYPTVTIPVKRMETDEEVNSRLRATQKRLEYERQQYEQLKKRFEK